MAEITLSPVPYAGGTLVNETQRHFCRLTATRFVAVYMQVDPDYVIGQVFDVDDIKSATPTAGTVRTQVIDHAFTDSTTNSGTRTCRLNDTDFLLVYTVGSSVSVRAIVCRVDPTTANIDVVSNEISWTFGGAGSTIFNSNRCSNFWNTNDNVIIHDGVSSISTGGTVFVARITWDTGTNTLARSILAAQTSFQTNSGVFSALTKSRTGDTWVYRIKGANQTNRRDTYNDTSSTALMALINPLTGTYTELNTRDEGGVVVMDTGTGYFVFGEDDTYRFIDAATPTSISNDVIFNAQTSSRPVNWGTWLNQDYFLIECMTTTTNESAYEGGHSYRVIRYVDDSFIEATTPTQGAVNITFGNQFLSMWNASPVREVFDSETILLLGLDDVTLDWRVEVLYAGS